MSLVRDAAGTNVDNLTYNYSGTGNRLNYVQDNNTTYAGEENHFKDGNPGTSTDYTYDANGNMNQDKNKGISSIAYNHLNLPKLITFANGNTIAYLYDASGIKLRKVVTESGTEKTTDYVGGVVYEDNVRKFMSTEEGRIMLESTPEYQYHMKDHLGNVRLTFTTASSAQQTSTYLATMETEVTTLEAATFNNIEATQTEDKIYNHTPGGKASARLNAVEDRVMGPSMTLQVMPGDTVRMKVQAKYFKKAKSKDPIAGMASIVAASMGAGTISEAPQIAQGIQETLGLGQAGLVSKDNTIPKAYINYLFFDTENNFKKGGYKQVSEAALGSFEELDLEYVPEEEGTMMIYTANQTAEDLDVYMDDLTILHTEGPIIRVDDYYPFGLTYHTSERTGYTTNNFLYNGNELQTELSLDLHDFNKRFYDAKLGRFISVDPLSELPSQYNKSPYQYGWNNPILLNDPNGDCPCLIPAIPWAIGIAEAIFFAGSATAITYVAYEQLGPDYDNLRVGTVHNPYEGSYLNTRDPKQPDFNIAKKVALIGTAMGLVARLMEKNAKFAGYEQIQIEEALKTMTPEELRDFNNRLRAALSLTYQKGDLTDQQAFGLANPSMLEAATIYNFTKDVYSLERGLTEEEQSKEDEKSEKGKKASQMINNFSNLEQGTYKWNGSDWVLE